MLGLIKLGQGVAVNVLQKLGLDLETVRMEVEKQVGTGPDQKMIGNIPYTPRVKKVLALAAKEARALNHTYVGTEHILLGLLREGDGVAARVLKNLDIDIEQTRQEILKELDPNFAAQEEQPPGEGTPNPAAERPPPIEKKGEVKTPALKAFGRDLTEIACRKGRWTPSSDGRTKSERVYPDRFAAAPRIIRCCWVKPAWARPPSWKVWPRKSRRATCPNCCVKSASSRWTLAL